MNYTFSCPAPCSRVIIVEANNDEDAVNKIIGEGAINCRSKKNESCCKKVDHLSPLKEKELREIVRLCMIVENQHST